MTAIRDLIWGVENDGTHRLLIRSAEQIGWPEDLTVGHSLIGISRWVRSIARRDEVDAIVSHDHHRRVGEQQRVAVQPPGNGRLRKLRDSPGTWIEQLHRQHVTLLVVLQGPRAILPGGHEHLAVRQRDRLVKAARLDQISLLLVQRDGIGVVDHLDRL